MSYSICRNCGCKFENIYNVKFDLEILCTDCYCYQQVFTKQLRYSEQKRLAKLRVLNGDYD